jgi:hypothetical protein
LRGPAAGKDDRISSWIDAELDRLTKPDKDTASPLMVVRLNRSEVRRMVRRPATSARWLRLGWLCEFPDVESMPLYSLEQALDGRGYTTNSTESVSVEELLPLLPETEAQWVLRRAATEVANDTGLRFLRYGGAVLAEPEPGQAPGADLVASTFADVTRMLSGNTADPLADRLHGLAARGKVGAVVTRLEIRPDLSSVQVETALLVRDGPERWVPARVRTATLRPDDLGPQAGEALADDPQVRAAFQVVESLGLGAIPADLKRRSLNVGAATQKALGVARSALQDDLTALALPVSAAPRAQADAKAAPVKP